MLVAELPITSAIRFAANAGWLKSHIDQSARTMADTTRVMSSTLAQKTT